MPQEIGASQHGRFLIHGNDFRRRGTPAGNAVSLPEVNCQLGVRFASTSASSSYTALRSMVDIFRAVVSCSTRNPRSLKISFHTAPYNSKRCSCQRLAECLRAVLTKCRGYAQSTVQIEDPEVVGISGKTHHPIVRYTVNPADSVSGTVFTITTDELRQVDIYDVGAHRRDRVSLRGRTSTHGRRPRGSEYLPFGLSPAAMDARCAPESNRIFTQKRSL